MTPKDSAKLPLELVARYTKEYPGVWDAAQTMREMPTDTWDKQRCYLPYEKGLYDAEFPSKNTLKIKKCRAAKEK